MKTRREGGMKPKERKKLVIHNTIAHNPLTDTHHDPSSQQGLLPNCLQLIYWT